MNRFQPGRAVQGQAPQSNPDVSCKTAWLLHKLRRAMADPERTALFDLVEVDESELPYRTKAEPPAGGRGRSHIGKLLVIGAVELSDEGNPRRIRLARLRDFSATGITGFIARVVAPGAAIVSDGLASISASKNTSTAARWSAAWPPISCCRGCTVSSPTSSAGAWAPSTACASAACNAVSTSSSSAGTGGGTPAPPLTRWPG